MFGVGSRAPIAISMLVKNPLAGKQSQVYLHDIGDYLSREEKLERSVALSVSPALTPLVAGKALRRTHTVTG